MANWSVRSFGLTNYFLSQHWQVLVKKFCYQSDSLTLRSLFVAVLVANVGFSENLSLKNRSKFSWDNSNRKHIIQAVHVWQEHQVLPSPEIHATELEGTDGWANLRNVTHIYRILWKGTTIIKIFNTCRHPYFPVPVRRRYCQFHFNIFKASGFWFKKNLFLTR